MSRRSVYLTPTSAHRRLGLVCLGVGRQDGRPAPVSGRVLRCHALVLVTRGSGQIRFGDGPRRRLQAPCVLLIEPGVRHDYAPDAAGWTEWWMLFDAAGATDHRELGLLAQRALTPVHPGPVRAALERLLSACVRQDDGWRDVTAAGLTFQVLLAAARNRQLEASTAVTALARLRTDAFAAASVRDQAVRLGLSVAELRELVRRETGVTPKQYVVQVRLNEAKTLLAGTDLPVGRVAARVGYHDPAYFSRLFSRHVGVSPIGFRAQEQRRATPPDVLASGTP